MILDEKNLGIGKIEIRVYNPIIHGKQISANIIDIYSKDSSCKFTFYTTIECNEFNKLELNKKTNMINGKYEFIDEDDLYFETKNARYIFDSLNVSMFITKKSNNDFIIEFETLNMSDDEIIDINSVEHNYKTLKIHANVRFGNIKDC